MARGLDTLSHALAVRLRNVARHLDRMDRLESGSGEWMENQTPAELESASMQMTLRLFRTVAEPETYAMLAVLAERGTLPVSELQTLSGLDRLSMNERLNDLIQVGLAGLEIDTNHVQVSESGVALIGLITDIKNQTTRRLTEYIAPVTTLTENK